MKAEIKEDKKEIKKENENFKNIDLKKDVKKDHLPRSGIDDLLDEQEEDLSN